MNVPFVDLKVQYQSIKPDIDKAIGDVIAETAFIGGKYVNEFEKKFAELYGVKHCISCANGTDSLYILMKMLGIGTGDEVITVANSWISSSETITQTGATPVFVDIDQVYYSIDEKQIESKITAKTKAIIPVHLHGQMCEMDSILEIAAKHNIPVIEDCAQSHFSVYKGKRAGTMGIAGSFSFYPGKNLGAYGDAGCIITDDDKLAENCKRYARHGALIKHQHTTEGVNSRLDGLQAAILSAKLPYILGWTAQRQANAKYYDRVLSGISQIVIPEVRPGTEHSYHLYVVRAERRDELGQCLKSKGIETSVHYPVPLPFMKAYQYLRHTEHDFPISNKYQHQILSLPLYPELSNEMMDYVSNTIKDFYSK
ncbi:MAG: putative PLP-dependent enzyme involved in cell wall biosis [Segetibacter sp.]|jgi:dTDP-4-amino-4,6-dideoxygalactose transaminase|nr:putative PLP-dependent enzyme involved in cell wall biosis [Segetibacter sp.]